MNGKRMVVIAAVLLVVAVVGWLVLRPGGGTADGPVRLSGATRHYSVELVIDSARLGRRAADVTVTPVNGASAPEMVAIEPAMAEHSHALAPVPATKSDSSHFHVSGELFLMAGRWEMTVAITAGGQREQVILPVTVT